jgi:hypothetical protein
VEAFLTHLAVQGKVAASTQNQALAVQELLGHKDVSTTMICTTWVPLPPTPSSSSRYRLREQATVPRRSRDRHPTPRKTPAAPEGKIARPAPRALGGTGRRAMRCSGRWTCGATRRGGRPCHAHGREHRTQR